MSQLECLTVTEWTESRNWTESTKTYEAKRSAQAQSPVSEHKEAWRLASVSSGNVCSAASPQPLVAAWSNLPIVIWYGES